MLKGAVIVPRSPFNVRVLPPWRRSRRNRRRRAPISTVRSSVTGLIGTAPEADATAFPLNTPVLVAGSRLEASRLGSTGTLPASIDGIFDQSGAMSARVAGMIARQDNDRGFWWSPSNTEMHGILGTARPVDFALGDKNARANHSTRTRSRP